MNDMLCPKFVRGGKKVTVQREPDRSRPMSNSGICRRFATGRVRATMAAGLLAGIAGHAASPGSAVPQHPAAALIEAATQAMRTDPETSRADAEKALSLLARTPSADLEIRAHLLLCDYQSERDSRAAEKEAAAASALLPLAHSPGLRAGVLLCQGAISETTGRNAQAMADYDQAVDAATRAQDDGMLAEALFSRGYLLGVEGEYAEGLAELKRSVSLFEKLGKPLHALTALDTVATLYDRLGDDEQARHIYTRALAVQRASGLLREQAVTLHNLGRADEHLHDWGAAREVFSESLALSRRIGYARAEAYALRGLAAVANATGDPEGALVTLERAEALQRLTPDARLHAQIALARGIALHRLHRLTESTTALQEAAGVFRRADAVGELATAESELAATYADAGNWREAFDLESAARATAERLLRNQIDQRFATLKVEFDTSAKEKENAALLRENAANQKALAEARNVRRLQAMVIVLAALLAVLLALLAVFLYRASARMRALAMTDELTGLPNRRAVLARLDFALRTPSSRLCAALIVDIDHFKEINDRHGHPAGDEVLKLMAAALRSSVGEPSFCGRLGGEEFLIVLTDTGLEAARDSAERFRERVEAIDVRLGGAGRRRITVSVGVADGKPGEDTPSTLLRRADAALYAAKRGGRNCVRVEAAELPQTGQLALDV